MHLSAKVKKDKDQRTDRNVCSLPPMELSRKGDEKVKNIRTFEWTNKIYGFSVMLAFSDGRHHRYIQH